LTLSERTVNTAIEVGEGAEGDDYEDEIPDDVVVDQDEGVVVVQVREVEVIF
jgi:hypothetical protein